MGPMDDSGQRTVMRKIMIHLDDRGQSNQKRHTWSCRLDSLNVAALSALGSPSGTAFTYGSALIRPRVPGTPLVGCRMMRRIHKMSLDDIDFL
jgi:hypothetical protein